MQLLLRHKIILTIRPYDTTQISSTNWTTYIGPGTVFGVLAHEIGHHIDHRQIGDLAWVNGNMWDKELRADAISGYALAKAGMSENEVKNALRIVSAQSDPHSPSLDFKVASS